MSANTDDGAVSVGYSLSADKDEVGTTGIIGATDVNGSGIFNNDLNFGASYISLESSSATISLTNPFFKPNAGLSRFSSSIIASNCGFLNCLSLVFISCFSIVVIGVTKASPVSSLFLMNWVISLASISLLFIPNDSIYLALIIGNSLFISNLSSLSSILTTVSDLLKSLVSSDIFFLAFLKISVWTCVSSAFLSTGIEPKLCKRAKKSSSVSAGSLDIFVLP